MRYSLSSEQCEFLLAFEASGNAAEMSRRGAMSLSSVFRRLNEIAALAPVVIKIDGKWRLTEAGKLLNSITRRFIEEQKSILGDPSAIRIGLEAGLMTPNELVQRMARLESHGYRVVEMTDLALPTLLDALSCWKIDLAITALRNVSPSIRAKVIEQRRIVPAAATSLDLASLRTTPAILPSLASTLWTLASEIAPVEIKLVPDLTTALATAQSGVGWTLAPMDTLGESLSAATLDAFRVTLRALYLLER